MRKAASLGTSGPSVLNFLWQDSERPVYVMDNHLGAFWCWLQELELADAYSLLHVDYHWDNAMAEVEVDDLPVKPDLDHLLSLRTPKTGNPSLRWDNYLVLLPAARPRANQAFLYCHQPDRGNPALGFQRESRKQSIERIEEAIRTLEREPGRRLVNLDLDFFFLAPGSGPTRRAYDMTFIEALVSTINCAVSNAVWTIAMSPECCGGWEPAGEVLDVVCATLDVPLRFAEVR